VKRNNPKKYRLKNSRLLNNTEFFHKISNYDQSYSLSFEALKAVAMKDLMTYRFADAYRNSGEMSCLRFQNIWLQQNISSKHSHLSNSKIWRKPVEKRNLNKSLSNIRNPIPKINSWTK
jgi:hypothetical protein